MRLIVDSANSKFSLASLPCPPCQPARLFFLLPCLWGSFPFEPHPSNLRRHIADPSTIFCVCLCCIPNLIPTHRIWILQPHLSRPCCSSSVRVTSSLRFLKLEDKAFVFFLFPRATKLPPPPVPHFDAKTLLQRSVVLVFCDKTRILLSVFSYFHIPKANQETNNQTHTHNRLCCWQTCVCPFSSSHQKFSPV